MALYKFSRFTVNGSPFNARTITVSILGNTNVTAEYVLSTTVIVTILPVAHATLSPKAGTYPVAVGSTMTFRCTPARGYRFIRWLVNGFANFSNPMTLTIVKDTTLQAVVRHR